uniref:NADH dehydrogenase subunit 2 n=1 Tax=Craseoa lathetica TaxID=316205 RepID=UPI0026E3077A|nr:NADH dehydrogenase subunit 2 [Craseoa lathetica]WJJ70146.1 NADH dehydrogenase subunit 2 [Craseoa lathetica]
MIKKMFIIYSTLVIFIYCVLSKINFTYNLEEFILQILVLLGSLIIITSNHFIILYLGLEIQTFSLFILISKNKIWLKSSEAGLKYFILGAMSSGFFLLGLTFLLINGSSLSYTEITTPPLILIILSFFFKISLFPFHFWSPDIYEGSSWKIIGFIGSLPKISILVILLQWGQLPFYYTCALLSIIIGTFGALNQTKLKRILAYSGISHFGFIILGLTLYNQTCVHVYLFVYFINLLLFIILLNNTQQTYFIELSKSIPLSLCLLSIAGLPPLIGFISKWVLFLQMLEEIYFFCLITCLVCTALSIYYYIRIISTIYFNQKNSFLLWNKLLHNKQFISEPFLIGFFFFITLFLILNPKPLFLSFSFLI